MTDTEREQPPEHAIQFACWIGGHDVEDISRRIHNLLWRIHENITRGDGVNRSVLGGDYAWAMLDQGSPTKDEFNHALHHWWERQREIAKRVEDADDLTRS